MENNTNTSVNDGIANTKDEELVLKGIQPRHQRCYKVYRTSKIIAFVTWISAAIAFGLRYVPGFLFAQYSWYVTGIFYIVLVGAIIFCFANIIKLLFLRKAPFDDWILDVAKKHLGTEVILYDSGNIYLDYDRTVKEQDKQDFLTDISDKSVHYTYFYVKTHIDAGYIQIQCKRKIKIPERATFSESDDIIWNAVPLGLTVNNLTQKVAPALWYINKNNTNPAAITATPSISMLIVGGTGSGKSVMEQNIIGHVSRYSDYFQLVGVDCKRVEFNRITGVKGVKSVALDVNSAADVIAAFRKQMGRRFEFIAKFKLNNIYDVPEIDVDYFTYDGKNYQFDEMFELIVDIDENDKNYSNLIAEYPNGRRPLVLTIEEIYLGVKEKKWGHPQMPPTIHNNGYIDETSIHKTVGKYHPKIMLLLCDELNELMGADEWKAVEQIKADLTRISRLGRAAAVHLALACQTASGDTIPKKLMDNIECKCLLGAFDSGTCTALYEKDITNLQKPEIKGRGFVKNGRYLYELQSYYTDPVKDWVFDEESIAAQDNPIFLKQLENRGESPKVIDYAEEANLTKSSDETIDDNVVENAIADDYANLDDAVDNMIDDEFSIDDAFDDMIDDASKKSSGHKIVIKL